MLNVFFLDVFGKGPYTGNPLTVVLQAEDLENRQMQILAQEFGRETCFILPPERGGDLRLRYFMPQREMELCGHATVGAIWVLYQIGELKSSELRVETPVGILTVSLTDEGVSMEQLPPIFIEDHYDLEALTSALSLDLEDVDLSLPVTSVSTGRAKLFIPLKNWHILDRVKPKPDRINVLGQKYNVTGLAPFTLRVRSQETEAEMRQFPVGGGILEDPVTGVAIAALGAYLRKHHLVNNREFYIEQGYAMGKPGRVKVTLKDSSIIITGKAIIIGKAGFVVP